MGWMERNDFASVVLIRGNKGKTERREKKCFIFMLLLSLMSPRRWGLNTVGILLFVTPTDLPCFELDKTIYFHMYLELLIT